MNSGNVYWDWPSMQDDSHSASILTFGNNDAEAFDYVHGKYRNAVTTALNLHGDGLSAMFISGGGNDFSGLNDLLLLLNPYCNSAHTAADCFKNGGAEGTIGGLMKKVTESHTLLIGHIMMKGPAGVKIFLHNYD